MSSNVNWNKIESILLDLDGTLLDLNFDLHFWLEYIPKVYSEKHNISFQEFMVYGSGMFMFLDVDMF